MAEAFNTKDVTGYEASEDACEFASRNWPDLEFVAGVVRPDITLRKKYDLILAQEFYPFTRTDDPAVHLEFIKILAASLTSNGVLLITLTAQTEQSVLNTLDKIEPVLRTEGFVTAVNKLPFDKVFTLLPIYWLAKIASNILGSLLKKPKFMVISISKLATN